MLHDYGVSLVEPTGWYTRAYRVIEPLRGAAIFQAATVPPVETDFSTYQPETCATLGNNDALLIAMVFDPDPITRTWSKPRANSLNTFAFSPGLFTHLQGLPNTQSQARYVFIHDSTDRICEIVACFGSTNPVAHSLGTILNTFRSLSIGSNSAKEPNGDAVEVSLA